jgi:hypothetical protein
MKPRKKRKISGIQISEISIVDHPASRHDFAVVKRDKVADPELEKLLEGWEDEALLKMTGEEAAAKLKAALTKLAEFKAELPDAISEAVAIILNVGGAYGHPAKDEDQDAGAGDGDGQDQGDGGDYVKEKEQLRKAAECFSTLSPQLLKIPFFRARLRKALEKADQDADDDQDQDQGDEDQDLDDGSEIQMLKREIARQGLEIKKLRRGRSSQGKEGVDDDEAVEKAGADFDPKTGKPTRDLFPSIDMPQILRGTRRS